MLQYNLGELQILQDNPTFRGSDWDKAIFNNVKKTIKKFYCRKQRRYCAYCKTELEVGCNSEHIEHIVDKSTKPLWMFEPLNLCLSCPQCNTKKSTKNTLKHFANKSIIVPNGSEYYNIVHPNFDNYDLHIDIEDGLFVKAVSSDKGANTIEMCGLWRPLYADRRARALSISHSDRYTIALHRVQRTDINQDEINAFIEYIDELIDIII